MIMDGHFSAIGIKGDRFFAMAQAASYYGLYHYWYLVPFNTAMFSASCGASAILTLMMMNANMSRNTNVVEVVVLPSRERVRFVTIGGYVYESSIKDVELIREHAGGISI